MKTTRELLSDIYLEWVNDYLTIEKYAEHHGLTTLQASILIALALDVHYSKHPDA